MAGGVYLLDESRAVVGRLDPSYATLTTVRRLWGIDSFSLEIDRRRLYASEIALGRWILLPATGELYAVELIDATREGSGRATSVMGRSIEGAALAERRVLPPAGEAYDRLVGVSAETAMKHYVAANAGPAADAARQIPGLAIAADALRGPTITTQGRYQALADLLSHIGMVAGLGWTTTYDRGSDTITFDVVEGVDRSASVFLDFAFETLESWERLDDATDSKTLAIVAGQGEGADRDVVLRWSGPEPTGLARREAFIDARDVDLGNTDLLEQRGDAFLAAAGAERRIEAKMHQYGSFRYGRDFDLGDLVLVRSDGSSFVSRVVEVTSKWSTSVETPEITLALDRPFPTLTDRVAAGSSSGAANPIVDSGAGGTHPDLPAHDALGLATDTELAAHAATPHGGASPGSGTVASAVGHSNAHGASSDYARTDHQHGREAFGAVQAETSFGLSAADGSATTVTRSDHRHGTPSLPATPTRTVYTTGSGNWSKPAGCRWVEVEVVGGGGGGGGAAATASGEKASGAGGAGGGYARKIFAASALSSTEPYAVGAAGSGATAGNNPGGAGGASYFGASGYRVQGNGGGGGGGGAAKAGVDTAGVLGGTGGTGSGGDINVTGDDGWTVRSAASGHVMPGNGGGSALGGQAQAPQGDSAGKTGKQYGGGGSGGYSQPSQSASAGGAGAAGVVIVTAHF